MTAPGEIDLPVPGDPPGSAGGTGTGARCGQTDIITVVTRQDQVDALAGCVEISGALIVDPPAGVQLDLRPLASVKRVWQDFMLGCNPLTLSSENCDNSGAASLSLEGLENLEAVGTLWLGGLSVTSLAPLSKLSNIGGFLDINQCDELTSLEGLEGLTLRYVALRSNARLASLSGPTIAPDDTSTIVLDTLPALTDLSALESVVSSFSVRLAGLPIQDLSALRNLREVSELFLMDLPELSDITGLSGLRELDVLVLVRTALEDLDSLQLERAGRLGVVENPRLTQVDQLGSLTALSELDVAFNAALQGLPAFPGVAQLALVNLRENAALVQGPSFPNLLEMTDGLTISGNPNLQRVDGFSSLEDAGIIHIQSNARLESVAFPELQSAFNLVISCNLALPDASLEPLSQVATLNGLQLVGNQGADAQCDQF